MSRRILLLLALIATSASAQPLAPPPDAAPGPEMTPEQKLAQFRHDQINLLALRGDTHSLLAAALMAQSDAGDKSRPAALQSPALLKRAQTIGADDMLVWWISAGFECRATKACPETETLQALEKTDAQNATTWLLALHRAQQTKDEATARAALTSAAQAAQYDDHFGGLIAMVYEAAGILPVGEEILRASGQTGVSAEGFKLTAAAGVAASLELPAAAALEEACKEAANDSALGADCVSVAQKMADSGSLAARGRGLKLQLGLLPAGAAQDAVQGRGRTLAWQTLRIGDAAARLTGDPRVTQLYTGTLHDSAREVDAVQAVLRNQGAALEPPADWKVPE